MVANYKYRVIIITRNYFFNSFVVFVVFHYTFHNIHRYACRRNAMLCVPAESRDNHATGDVEDHKVLRR